MRSLIIGRKSNVMFSGNLTEIGDKSFMDTFRVDSSDTSLSDMRYVSVCLLFPLSVESLTPRSFMPSHVTRWEELNRRFIVRRGWVVFCVCAHQGIHTHYTTRAGARHRLLVLRPR
jgi:hypothetical protein